MNIIVGGVKAAVSNRKQRFIQREVHLINTQPVQYLRWSEFPITFSRENHWVHIPDPGSYPLVVSPTIDEALLSKMLIDGGSGLNIIFTATLR